MLMKHSIANLGVLWAHRAGLVVLDTLQVVVFLTSEGGKKVPGLRLNLLKRFASYHIAKTSFVLCITKAFGNFGY